ncbi:MAG TPA: hypothetical protein VGO78_19810, partial [Acidimicrobiales bacterium]|nr:hypothetical protein [Acidimicrobiales bacterium]
FDSSQTADANLTVDHCFSEYAEGVPGLPVSAGSATQWVQNYLAEGWMVEDGTQVVDGRELIRLREVPVDEIDPDSGLGKRIEARNEALVEVPSDDGGSSTPRSTEGDPEMSDFEEALDQAQAAVEAAQNAGEGEAEMRDLEEALDAAQTAVADAAQSEDDEDQSVALVDPETYRPVQLIGPGHSYVQTYEYLPRTPGNLALLEAQVPEGFTEVPNVRGDGERADIGCH